jgi:hypothetical protein
LIAFSKEGGGYKNPTKIRPNEKNFVKFRDLVFSWQKNLTKIRPNEKKFCEVSRFGVFVAEKPDQNPTKIRLFK